MKKDSIIEMTEAGFETAWLQAVAIGFVLGCIFIGFIWFAATLC